MTDQPKECPCCGADAEVIDNQIVGGSTVLCTNGKCSLRTGLFLTRGMALTAWNKRPALYTEPQVYAAVKKTMDSVKKVLGSDQLNTATYLIQIREKYGDFSDANWQAQTGLPPE